jgi:hypothetical protein
MPDDIPEYPPQFASSDLSSLLGQITDFAGNEPPPEQRSVAALLKGKAATKFKGKGDPIAQLLSACADGSLPVTVKGIDAPKGPYFAGLREVLIGVSIIRLAEQLKALPSAEARSKAISLGESLIQSGSARLVQYRYPKPQ